MTMLIIMYIPIIMISSAIDIPEASPIIDDEEDMDEGAVNEGVGDEEDVMNEEVTDDKDKEDRNKKVMNEAIGDEAGVMNEVGVMDEEDRDEDKEVRDKEDRDVNFMDEGVWVKVPTN